MKLWREPALYFGILLGIVIALSISGRSEGLKLLPETGLRIEIAFGQGRYQKSPDGMWWQSDQLNNSRYKDNGSGEIGIAGKLNPVFGWSVRYVNLGRVHVNALIRSSPSDNTDLRPVHLDPDRAECSVKFSEANCRYQSRGDGGIKGLNFAISMAAGKIWRVEFEPELGFLVYQQKFNSQFYPQGCRDSSDCAWRETMYQKTRFFVSPMAGLTVRLPLDKGLSVFIATRYYLRTSQHTPMSAGYSGPAQATVAGLSFDL